MGACSSLCRDWRYAYGAYAEKIRAMDLSKSEAKQLRNLFRVIDADNSGYVDHEEFFEYLQLEPSKFAERTFSMFDEKSKGELDFGEFCVALYTFCTANISNLSEFIFEIYDTDGSRGIDPDELVEIVKEVYNKDDGTTESFAKSLLEQVRAMDGVDPSIEDIDPDLWVEFAASQPALLFPATYLKSRLADRIVGTQFWDGIADKRASKFPGGGGSLDDIMETVGQKKSYGISRKVFVEVKPPTPPPPPKRKKVILPPQRDRPVYTQLERRNDVVGPWGRGGGGGL